VHLPEFDCYTHGETYLEAVKMGEEALEMLVEDMTEHHETLPLPNRFNSDEMYKGVA
ncbi:MAG: HicB like antitoxin of bacterial toxin-antitoxin system, partial [Deinococcota bacterium]